ncbi:lamin tail domain-containing protein [Brachybacterium sp. DNPG3]
MRLTPGPDSRRTPPRASEQPWIEKASQISPGLPPAYCREHQEFLQQIPPRALHKFTRPLIPHMPHAIVHRRGSVLDFSRGFAMGFFDDIWDTLVGVAEDAAEIGVAVGEAVAAAAIAIASAAEDGAEAFAKALAESAAAVANGTEELLRSVGEFAAKLGASYADAAKFLLEWALMGLTAFPPKGDIAIYAIRVTPPGVDFRKEYAVICNLGSDSVSLEGWTLRDLKQSPYRFPSWFTLEPKQHVKVWTGPGSDDQFNLYMGRRRAVWNNLEFDLATLTDAEGVIQHQRVTLGIHEALIDGIFEEITQAAPQLKRSLDGRKVDAVPSLTASAVDIAAAPRPTSHDDTGAVLDYRLVDGRVRYTSYWLEESGGSARFATGHQDAVAPSEKVFGPERAITYHHKRVGTTLSSMPRFDMIAASGTRIIAKQVGVDRFWFATPGETFTPRVHGGPVPPSTYFKLDPERYRALPDSLTPPLDGDYDKHPASARFGVFKALLWSPISDRVGLPVKVAPLVWHEIDSRPPLGHRLPAHLPRYPHVEWSMAGMEDLATSTSSFSIDFDQVLSLGVGHAHWYSHCSMIYGQPIQALFRDVPLLNLFPARVEWLYRMVNGPVRDGDGFIDGTCNFYALVRLRREAGQSQKYALLWLDEQSWFTHRWREVHPDDHHDLMLALVRALADDKTFSVADFWCPFRNNHISEHSRLAAAATVLVVNGVDPETEVEQLYSLNFSYATCDRTWAKRPLPPVAVLREDDDLRPDGPDGVIPETLGIRDDMTIHLRGRKDGTVGRWFQSFVPKGRFRIPEGASGLAEKWQFVSEAAFLAMTRFSHFGVYRRVASRSQYYRVRVASGMPALLASPRTTAWRDEEKVLAAEYLGIDLSDPGALGSQLWEAAFELHTTEKQPPSLFNDTSILSLYRHSDRFGWIATWHDKRDDDLKTLAHLGREVVLTSGQRSATVALDEHHEVWFPPSVDSALVRLEHAADGTASLTIELAHIPPSSPTPGLDSSRTASIDAYGESEDDQFFGNVAKVHLQGLSDDLSGAESPSVDLGSWKTDGLFTRARGVWKATVPVPPRQVALFEKYCSGAGRRDRGTSLWFEDIVGNVAAPDVLEFEVSGNR